MFKRLSNIMNRSSSATLPKAVAPAQERKPLAPLPPQQRNGSYTNEDFSDTASGDSSLEGNVEIRVLLPDGTSVFMSVERRMPVMDLLVHVATAHKLSPGSHQINIFNAQDSVLNYKASTPIGTLNTSTVQLVPKRNDVPSKKLPKQAQPFEQTFRLQVHLPRQQLVVVRVSPHTRLSDIFKMVCQQKELDQSRYALQHPTSTDMQLDLNRTLADYNLTEINMISKRNSIVIPSRHSANVEFHTVESEERKSKQLFGLMFRRNNSSLGDSSGDEYNNRGCSSAKTETDYHKSESSLAVIPPKKVMKKRAAPLPPATKPKSQGERPPPPPPLHSKTKSHSTNELQQSHSRHSSDSSGYHESSVLGDECLEIETARSSSNLTSTASTSTTSIVSGIKKRRAPPPPIAKKVEEETGEEAPHPQPRLSKSAKTTEETISNEQSSQLPLSPCDPSLSVPESPLPITITSPEPLEAVSSAELPPSDDCDKVFEVIEEPEPVLEPILVMETNSPSEYHDPSLLSTSGTTSHEHPTLACDGIDQSNFCFDITVDKYREEETSGSCSRSDTHTTDSAVADLDLDASGSTSWSPIPEIKPTFTKEISVTADVHCEETEITNHDNFTGLSSEIEKSYLKDDEVDACLKLSDESENLKDRIDHDNTIERKDGFGESKKNVNEEHLETFMEEEKRCRNYDWFSSSKTISNLNHDDWIKSNSDDEHETIEAPSSPSSYYSVEDIAASFEEVIADAEFALRKDEKEISKIFEEHLTQAEAEEIELPRFFRRTRPLVNFSIDTYKSRNDNDESKLLTYSESFTEREKAVDLADNRVARSSSMHEKNIAQNIQFKMAPYDNLKRQHSQIGEGKTDSEVFSDEPKNNLNIKSKSMMNLLDNDAVDLKRTNSEQQMNTTDEFSNSQANSPECLKLQEECMKLQQQLIRWQQQLMNNQALLQQQQIVPQDMVGLAPEMVDILQNNLEKQNFISADNIAESSSVNKITGNDDNVSLRKTEKTIQINEQQRAKSYADLNPVQPFSKPKPKQNVDLQAGEEKISTNKFASSIYSAPVFRVESMKNPERAVNEMGSEEETKVVKGESVLPSIKDRISLFLGKKNENREIKKSDNSSENSGGKSSTNKDDEIVKNNFERGLLARKPIKISHHSNGVNGKESDKAQSHAKFRRQRITPNYLEKSESDNSEKKVKTSEKSKPVCNGQVVRDTTSKPIEVAQVRKPKPSRPLIFTYFGDTVTDKASFKRSSESNQKIPNQSAITKVATSEVLSHPNLPLQAMNSDKNEKKMGNGPDENTPPAVMKKPVKSRTALNGGNKFATAPNTRDMLMDSIREFGGRNQLRKVPKSETYWHSWHGEVA